MFKTEIPDAKSMSKFPSTSSTTDPDARRTTIGADFVVVATYLWSRSIISRAFGPGGVTLMSGTFTIAPESGLAPGRINSLLAENLRCEKRAGAAYFAAPIRIIVVPQTGHFPFIAGLPFLSFTATAFLISRLARHFTQ